MLSLQSMQFSQIINAALSKENDRPLMQKEVYPVSDALQQYLQHYKRDIEIPIDYKELFHYQYTNAIKDKNGKHTHWENVVYDAILFKQLEQKLTATYRLLKKQPATAYQIAAIDFCEFANSMPFRIIIVNTANGTEDYFYIKASDASRIYGLELEQLLSPNRINFLYHQNTLVEEHIEGIPGDVFLETVNGLTSTEKKLLAAEFVRFNERCFARLLGDMRSYNFVVVKNETGNNTPFRIKAIDFDQQCYEGKANLYLPQFYKENHTYVQMALHQLGNAAIERIRTDERKQLAQLAELHQQQLSALFHAMIPEEISENYKVVSLRKELDAYFNTNLFAHCKSMGAIVQQQVNLLRPLKGEPATAQNFIPPAE